MSCAEWTGVLRRRCSRNPALKGGAKWFVAEAQEEVKGASSMPIGKAMDDCLVAYGMNGEAVRPQNGFPVRLMVPGFEGIFHTKYLRRIKIVDRYYMNYNDFGHLDQDAKVAALEYQIGPKSVITFPSGEQRLPGKGFYEISGLAWSGGGAIKLVEVSTDGGRDGTRPSSRTPQRMALPVSAISGLDGTRPRSCRGAPTNWARCNRCAPSSPSTGTNPTIKHSACPGWTTVFSRGTSRATGA